MTRRFKRLRNFDVTLDIKNDQFIRPPREAQRNWLLNRVMTEFTEDLNHLDTLAGQFVPGQERTPLQERTRTPLTDQEIMEDWQTPIMEIMARIATETHGDVLEIGFGRGVSATAIQRQGVRSHTIIECNDSVVERLQSWRAKYPNQDIRVIHSKWQDVEEQTGAFDAVFFHTYPLNDQEYLEQAVQSATFAEHFFPTAAAHLRDGGVFTYLTNEIDSLSRGHQRVLFKHFHAFTMQMARNLPIPQDVKDAWWTNMMVIIKAIK